MSDQELGKKEVERAHLQVFLDAYEIVTGEAFSEPAPSETPDFICSDQEGRVVGIEITQLCFPPDEQFMRQISPPELGDADAFWKLLELTYKKDCKLKKGNWGICERKLLVIISVDASISDLDLETDKPTEGGFDEVWLVDDTQVDIYGSADLFALVHPELSGYFATRARGEKPYG